MLGILGFLRRTMLDFLLRACVRTSVYKNFLSLPPLPRGEVSRRANRLKVRSPGFDGANGMTFAKTEPSCDLVRRLSCGWKPWGEGYLDVVNREGNIYFGFPLFLKKFHVTLFLRLKLWRECFVSRLSIAFIVTVNRKVVPNIRAYLIIIVFQNDKLKIYLSVHPFNKTRILIIFFYINFETRLVFSPLLSPPFRFFFLSLFLSPFFFARKITPRTASKKAR